MGFEEAKEEEVEAGEEAEEEAGGIRIPINSAPDSLEESPLMRAGSFGFALSRTPEAQVMQAFTVGQNEAHIDFESLLSTVVRLMLEARSTQGDDASLSSPLSYDLIERLNSSLIDGASILQAILRVHRSLLSSFFEAGLLPQVVRKLLLSCESKRVRDKMRDALLEISRASPTAHSQVFFLLDRGLDDVPAGTDTCSQYFELLTSLAEEESVGTEESRAQRKDLVERLVGKLLKPEEMLEDGSDRLLIGLIGLLTGLLEEHPYLQVEVLSASIPSRVTSPSGKKQAWGGTEEEAPIAIVLARQLFDRYLMAIPEGTIHNTGTTPSTLTLL